MLFCMPRQASSAFKRQVGNNLRLFIEAAAGGNQAEFARRFGVSPSKLGNWIRGDNLPDPYFLSRVCEDYGVTMDWFYRGVRAGVAAALAENLRAVAQEKPAAPAALPAQAHDTQD